MLGRPDLMASAHENLPGRVVELRRLHRFDDGDIVDHRRQMGEQVRKLRAALAVTCKGMRRAQQFRRSFDEREPLALDDVLRNRLAVVLIELRLVIEQVELRGRAGHEEEDNLFGFRREVRRPYRHGIGRRLRKQAAVEQRAQRQRTDAEAGLLEEVTPCLKQELFRLHFYYSLVKVSSRLSRTLESMVQAARSGSSAPVIRLASSRCCSK
jgi:hypothetical protein